MTVLGVVVCDSFWFLAALVCLASSFLVFAVSKLYFSEQYSKGKRKELQRPLLKGQSLLPSQQRQNTVCEQPDSKVLTLPSYKQTTRSRSTKTTSDSPYRSIQQLFPARTALCRKEITRTPNTLKTHSKSPKKSPRKNFNQEPEKGGPVPQSLLGEALSIIGHHRYNPDLDVFELSLWDSRAPERDNYSSTSVEENELEEEEKNSAKQNTGFSHFQSECLVLLEISSGENAPETPPKDELEEEVLQQTEAKDSTEKALVETKVEENQAVKSKPVFTNRKEEGIKVEKLFDLNDSLDAGLAWWNIYHNDRIWSHDCYLSNSSFDSSLMDQYDWCSELTDSLVLDRYYCNTGCTNFIEHVEFAGDENFADTGSQDSQKQSVCSSTSSPESMADSSKGMSSNDGDVSSNVSSGELDRRDCGERTQSEAAVWRKQKRSKLLRRDKKSSSRGSSTSEDAVEDLDKQGSQDESDDLDASENNAYSESPTDSDSVLICNLRTTPKVYYKVDFDSDSYGSPGMEWSTRIYDDGGTAKDDVTKDVKPCRTAGDIVNPCDSITKLPEQPREQTEQPTIAKHCLSSDKPTTVYSDPVPSTDFADTPEVTPRDRDRPRVTDSSTDTGVQLSSGSVCSLVCENEDRTKNSKTEEDNVVSIGKNHLDTILRMTHEPVGASPPVEVLQYADQEWRGTTPKALLMKKGYSRIPAELGLSHICRIRGDHFCGLRAAIFQVLYHGLDILQDYSSPSQFTQIPAQLLREGCHWLKDWQFASAPGITLTQEKFTTKMELILRTLFNQVKVLSEVADRVDLVFDLFTVKKETEFQLLEAVKFLMLLKAVQFHRAMSSGEDVPLVAFILFSRDSSTDPESFMRNHLNHVGVSGGLEQVEMFLLGHALGITLKVVRVSQADEEDFITLYPDDLPGSPVVTLVAEDDRHYNILL